jgi:Kef-type K+ transport system membrane component KefB
LSPLLHHHTASWLLIAIHFPIELWGDCIAVILIAIGAKFIPAMFATKWCAPADPDTGKRPTWKFAATMGFIMNTRGLVELIALNIAHDSVMIPFIFVFLQQCKTNLHSRALLMSNRVS